MLQLHDAELEAGPNIFTRSESLLIQAILQPQPPVPQAQPLSRRSLPLLQPVSIRRSGLGVCRTDPIPQPFRSGSEIHITATTMGIALELALCCEKLLHLLLFRPLKPIHRSPNDTVLAAWHFSSRLVESPASRRAERVDIPCSDSLACPTHAGSRYKPIFFPQRMSTPFSRFRR